MGKNKHKRFEENRTFTNLLQPEFSEVFQRSYKLKGRWRDEFFGNPNPIVLELGCGRGEYTVALGEMFPEVNFLGIDIKGARMWRGAKTATEKGLHNVGFIRTRIELIDSFFDRDEVDGMWITFPDPQLKKQRIKKRLTAPEFLGNYAKFLTPESHIHLKTDSRHLHDYTITVLKHNGIQPDEACADIYGTGRADDVLSIKTAYEQEFLAQGAAITYLRFGLGDIRKFDAPDFAPDNELAEA
ncbi:tRNA (guanosine(46)-N7)-methyltransferase TrmB [Alistipes sp. OttesenSCG-928-B03]|nr:tRNA (guanosine(46)-N7)-methyltransferase TrmB [Alistipes sp. OttesenSCG-928-B03]